MRQRVLTLSSVGALLLSLVTIGLWIRSYQAGDLIGWKHGSRHGADYSVVGALITSAGGGVGLGVHAFTQFECTAANLQSLQRPPRWGTPLGNHLYYNNRDARRYALTIVEQPTAWNRLGFIYRHEKHERVYDLMDSAAGPVSSESISVAVPHWCLAGVFALLSATAFGRLMSRLRANAKSLCPHCGYDLRATPDRCPECGKEVARSGA